MIGTIVNTTAILIGGTLGLLVKKGISEKVNDTLMNGLALCVLYIGVNGALEGQNTMIIIISMVIGALIGELIDLDKGLRSLGSLVEEKFKSKDEKTSIAEGLVTASLLFCVGAMAIVGSLESGLTSNHEMLFTKSILDGVSSILFASSLGIGVLFSAGFVFVYQSTITLLAQFISPYLGQVVIAEMTCIGSLLIIGLALNMLKVTKLKVMNYLPAIFLPIFVYMLI